MATRLISVAGAGFYRSLVVNYLWTAYPAIRKSECKSGKIAHADNSPPCEYCSCGFWGYIGPEALTNTIKLALDYAQSIPIIVECYGKIVLHEFGLRAEYVKPIGVIEGDWTNSVGICAVYFGVPILSPLEAQIRIDHNEIED